MTNTEHIITSEEDVARLLHREWFANGILQQTAFQLRNGEVYLSVNRPAVSTYADDVNAFIAQHPMYKANHSGNAYRRAMLNVGSVREIEISFNEQKIDLEVEVEPRASRIRSHAGVFARLDGKNIKGGQDVDVVTRSSKVVSTLAVMQKMRWKLLQMAKVETCGIKDF